MLKNAFLRYRTESMDYVFFRTEKGQISISRKSGNIVAPGKRYLISAKPQGFPGHEIT